jgi:hypothetical protein
MFLAQVQGYMPLYQVQVNQGGGSAHASQAAGQVNGQGGGSRAASCPQNGRHAARCGEMKW